MVRESTRNPETQRGLKDTVLSDFRQREFKRNLRTEFGDLYRFYLDEETRDRLARMGRVRRWLSLVWWLVKSLLLNLSPVRRLMLLAGLVMFGLGDFAFSMGNGVTFGVDLRFVGFLAVLLVLMLELKDKLLARDELEVGRAVQVALLPEENPSLSGWEIWLYTRPANDVGGDLVDYLEIDGGLGLALGDVSGKGLGAALLMAKLQATIRAVAADYDSLSALGQRLNYIFCRDQVDWRFSTLVYLVMTPGAGRIRVLNAGHLPPVVVGKSGVTSMDPVAPPLGLLQDAAYREQSLEVEPGELLILYSDGVTEARNADKDLYGEERLLELLAGLRGMSAPAAGLRILSEVERFMGEERSSDDISMIVIKRLS